MTALPAAWRSETLSALTAGGLFCDGDWVESKDQDPSGSVRLTQLADVGVAEFRARSDRWLREDQASRLGCTFLEPGDVLIARMPDPLGRACLAPDGIGRAVTAVDVAIARPSRPDLDPRFLMWALNTPDAHAQMVSMQSGTTRKRISRKNLGTVRLPLPPLDEQRRIVDILEDHLSRLDAAASYLGRADAGIGAAQAALLERVGRHTAAAVSLGDLAVSSGYGTSTKCGYDATGAPVLRIPNLVGRQVDLEDLKFAVDPAVDLSRLMLSQGDLLIVRTNGSRDLIGRTAVVPGGVEASFASYLIRYRLDERRVRPEWVSLMLERPTGRRLLEGLAASSAGQYNLSLGKLDGVAIPVPPLADQDALVKAVHALARGLDGASSEVSIARARSQALRSALLAAAFSGRLSAHPSDLDLAEEVAAT